jgi:hypothetical protein
MRTPAQVSRDAALRRLSRINRSLAIAAVVGAGVITDVVANTASGQTRTNAKAASNTPATNKPELLVSGGTSHSAARKAAAARHRAAAAARRRTAAEHKRAQATASTGSSASTGASASTSSSVSAGSSTAPVVAVSGGS